MAKANNVDGNSVWNTEILSDIQLVNLLLVLIGKSLDTQSVFGRGHDSGYVDDSSQNYGMLNSGTMDTKGMFWGSNDGTSGVKVFGMENWWGNEWRRYAGDINDNGVHKVKYTYGTEDGSTEVGFNTTGQGYKVTNEALPSANTSYIQKMKFEENEISPLTAGGTSSTYYCDALWTNNAQVNYALRGGNCGNGAPCGAFCLGLFNDPANGWRLIGASLSCKPSINSNTKENSIATLENYGRVKLSNASNITDSTGLALPASEKNPNVSGTLASKIAVFEDALLKGKYFLSFSSLNAANTNETSILFAGWVLHEDGVTDNLCPYPNKTGPMWWNVIQIGNPARLTRIASQAFIWHPGKDEIWIQSKHDSEWSAWKKLGSDSAGGHVVSSTAPSNTNLLWVDTGNGGILKYYNGSAWTPIASTWG